MPEPQTLGWRYVVILTEHESKRRFKTRVTARDASEACAEALRRAPRPSFVTHVERAVTDA